MIDEFGDCGALPVKNDPINPAHYDGTACAQIGERLTANSYQVLKYNWRLGKKDDPVIELGKSIWYLDREIKLAERGWDPRAMMIYGVFPGDTFFANLLHGVDAYVEAVAWALILWTKHGDIETLNHLRNDIVQRRAQFETLATGQHTMGI